MHASSKRNCRENLLDLIAETFLLWACSSKYIRVGNHFFNNQLISSLTTWCELSLTLLSLGICSYAENFDPRESKKFLDLKLSDFKSIKSQ